MPDHPPSPDTSYCLLYDGDCPMCSAFASAAGIAEGGQLKKIDAREESSLRTQATTAGMDLDYGIVVEHRGELYYGADALNYLASRKHSSLRMKLLYLPFRSRKFARAIYPLLVRLRYMLLWMRGKSLIGNVKPGS